MRIVSHKTGLTHLVLPPQYFTRRNVVYSRDLNLLIFHSLSLKKLYSLVSTNFDQNRSFFQEIQFLVIKYVFVEFSSYFLYIFYEIIIFFIIIINIELKKVKSLRYKLIFIFRLNLKMKLKYEINLVIFF